MARTAGLPVRRNRVTTIHFDGQAFKIRLVARPSANCPMLWWVHDHHPTRLLICTPDSPSARGRSSLTWGASLITWPHQKRTLHPTAAAAVADLMHRYYDTSVSSAQAGLLAAAFGGAPPEVLEHLADKVVRDSENEADGPTDARNHSGEPQ